MATVNAINTGDPIGVSNGGTGVAATTAYAIICGGTTTTGPIQFISSLGSSGQILSSQGAASLPTFIDAPDMNVFATPQSSDPGSPADGDIWLNTTSNAFKGQANGTIVTFTVT